MIVPAPPPEQPPRPVVDGYTVVCIAALLAIVLIEVQATVRLTTPLILVVGLAGLLLRWRVAPVLLVLAVAGASLMEQWRQAGFGWEWPRAQAFRVSDVVLSVAVLAYVVAHYRMQSLTGYIFPPDPRRREEGAKRQRPVVKVRRSAHLASPEEIGLLVMLLPLPALVAQVCWVELARPWGVLGLPPQIGRLLLVVWVLAVGLFLIAALLGHWRTRRMTRAEAILALQDTLWQETRREQRQVNRWVAWSRLRRRRREES